MIFYGGAIQGALDREKLVAVHKELIQIVKDFGFELFTEHTGEEDLKKIRMILEQRLGKLPDDELERRTVVRDKIIQAIEGEIDAAIFEVSTPSLGTGVEIAHAYLRPRLGLKPIPILVLYKKDFWPNKLSTMVRGISPEKYSNFELQEYLDAKKAKLIIQNFLTKIEK